MAQTKEGAIKLASKHYKLSVEEYLEKIKTESYCNKCKSWKPNERFCKDKSRSLGLHKNCNDCRWTNGGKKGAKKGRPSPMKGKHFSEKARENIRKASKIAAKKRIGTKKIYTKQGYENLIKALKKPRPNIQGDKSPNWKGGHNKNTAEGQRGLNRAKLREWKKLVLERDKHICQDCGEAESKIIQAHHIKEYSKFPDLRYEISNGITVCKTCHEKRHFNPNSTRNIKRKKKGLPLKF